jgi:hypothetical protein
MTYLEWIVEHWSYLGFALGLGLAAYNRYQRDGAAASLELLANVLIRGDKLKGGDAVDLAKTGLKIEEVRKQLGMDAAIRKKAEEYLARWNRGAKLGSWQGVPIRTGLVRPLLTRVPVLKWFF